MKDATNMRTLVSERDHTLALRPARMPEESVTVNIVRRIAVAAKRSPNIHAQAILHTRALESGNNKVKNQSKADLELTIRLGSYGYWNFALQAKSFRPADGRYRGWSALNNQILEKWAQQRRQTPAMLLYNEECHPFSPLATGTFGLCQLATHYERNWHGNAATNQQKLNPLNALTGTPAGISICLLNSFTLLLNDPKPQDFQSQHFPIEHLLHDSSCNNIAGGTPGSKPPNGSQTAQPRLSLVEQVRPMNADSLPPWAKVLASFPNAENPSPRRLEDLEHNQQAAISADLEESGTKALIFLDLDI